MKNKKLLIGITGAIGSGKTLFANFLLEKKEVVFFADQLAKKLMSEDELTHNSILKLLGKDSFFENGSINTKFISDIIFNDPVKYKKLIKVVHGRTITELLKLSQQAFKTTSLVFIESALIFESKFDKHLDYIILLKSDLSTRLARIKARDKIDTDKFFQITQYQIDPDEAEKLSDITIYNNNSLAELEQKFEIVYKIIKAFV